jgi:hypothetical protein
MKWLNRQKNHSSGIADEFAQGGVALQVLCSDLAGWIQLCKIIQG